jgi:hypothetical protein
MLWWSANLLCPTCQQSTSIRLVEYSTDGGIRITSYCVNCNQGCRWETTSDSLKEMARMADEKANLKQEENPAQKPKKQLPILQEHLSAEDIEFLKKWNIKP